MGEIAFTKVQLGRQASFGTAVAATSIFPAEPGTVIDLDRNLESPDEDYGGLSRHRSGRAFYGARGAQLTLGGHVRFPDIVSLLEMHLAGGITAVQVGVTGDYTHTYTGDETATTIRPYTIEVTDDTQGWRITDCVCDELEIGFDALSAPGASPWTFRATILGKDREKFTATSGLSAPADLETPQGHLTALYEGATGTAFASLSELTAHLIQYRVRSSLGLVRRLYGGTADTTSSYGRGKREVSVDAMVKISASSTANVHDIYNGTGSVATERRWRVKSLGSALSGGTVRALTVDHRLRFTGVPLADRDGERTYGVEGHAVYDSTLGSDIQVSTISRLTAAP